jgi:hypothetical protein
MKKIVLFLFFGVSSYSQDLNIISSNVNEIDKKESKKNWFESISMRGYAQMRYNKLLETNPDLGCEQCDRSWGGDNSFFIRRGRIIFSGNVHDRVFIYIQPDFASAAGTTNMIFQIRDAYFDLALDDNKEYRIRFGQSKVPYGFENMHKIEFH